MSLQFQVWPADDVRAMAVCRVKEHKISMTERRNTVFDERMGPIGYMEKCATCASYIADCAGHCELQHYTLSPPTTPLF